MYDHTGFKEWSPVCLTLLPTSLLAPSLEPSTGPGILHLLSGVYQPGGRGQARGLFPSTQMGLREKVLPPPWESLGI